MKKKIIIIEDNVLLSQAYEYCINSFKEYDLKGVFGTVEDALNSFKKIKPNIILSDISVPGISGIEGIKKFKKIDRSVKVIIVSIHDDLSYILDSLKNLADGYLTKPIKKTDLKNALDMLQLGGAPLSNNVSKKLIGTFQSKELELFSERENQIVDLLTKGYTYTDISEKLFITHSTVNYHMQNIYVKLNVTSKSDAIKKINQMKVSD